MQFYKNEVIFIVANSNKVLIKFLKIQEMKPKLLLIIKLSTLLFFTTNVSAQFGITSINTISNNLPSSDTIFNRKGAGVQSMNSGLSGRWDSANTNFKLLFNAGNRDKISINDISITELGVGTRLPFTAIAKVRRVVNAQIANTGDHFPYFAAVESTPSSTETTGTFLINAPEVTSMENALVSNNINIGYDNIFQNNNANVHYGNIERIDYIIPSGFTPEAGSDFRKIGFTIYDGGADGNPFKIAGISALNNLKDPIGYVAPLTSITTANYGNKLLSSFTDFVIFQKDPDFNISESRPSIKVNQNMRGVFVSLASLGFVEGQKVYGFSIFGNDISAASTEAYLLGYENFPTNTNSSDMLDLVNSIGGYTFDQTVVLSSPTVLNATLQNTKVFLQWNTTSFADAQKIYLQRASGNMVYSNLIEINSNQPSFIDKTAREDIVYYRLKIITASGTIKYSNIQLIRSKFSYTQIFPTVANDQLYITSNSIAINKPIAISIYNVDGKLIQSISKTASRSMSVDVAYLKKAMYIICITQNNEVVIRQKFIKN
jgi:Secretion system C-terminal sorting domain